MESVKGQVTKHRHEKPLGSPFKKPLPVKLTDAEIIARSAANGKLQEKVDKEEAELKEASAGAKTSIAEKKAKLRTGIKAQATGTEEREVACLHLPVWDQNLVEIVRTDDWTIVDTRPMAATERQREMGVVDGGVKDVKGDGKAKGAKVFDMKGKGAKEPKGDKDKGKTD